MTISDWDLAREQEIHDRVIAAQVAIGMYAGEPCRICGKEITVEDLHLVVFAGYSDDSKSRAAHGLCWSNLVDVVRKAHANGQLDALLRR